MNKKILKDLQSIFGKKVKETDKTDELENFDSIIILQIMNLAKTEYKKNVNGLAIVKCKKIIDIIKLLT